MHFDYIDYTTDLDKVQAKIKKSRASGGGDEAEDVKGALDFAFTLNAKSNVQLIYMICDAPTHGKQYHGGAADDRH